MSNVWTKTFWKDMSDRALGTAAATALSIFGMEAFDPTGFDWQRSGVLVLIAVGVTVLKGIVVATTVVGDGTASPVNDVVYTHK